MYFIDAGIVSPERSIGLDRDAFANGDELLMIHSRDRPTVSLGRFTPMDSVDMGFANAEGISVVRRISGGSAIFSDSNQLTITLVMSRNRFNGKTEAYEYFGKNIVDALSELGIETKYKPVNDILLNGGKISGSAQYRNVRTVMVHGSLVLRMDERYLKVLREVKKIKHPVTSIEKECGFVPDRRMLFDALKNSFDR